MLEGGLQAVSLNAEITFQTKLFGCVFSQEHREANISPPLQARPGPAQAKFGKSGDLEIQKFWIHKMKKVEILKFQILSSQNVGKVWISWKKIILAPFGAIPGHFLHGSEKCKKCTKFAYFPWWANGPYSPGLGVGVRCWLLKKAKTLFEEVCSSKNTSTYAESQDL